MTTVSGTFSASGVSATLAVRNQVENINYDFAAPGDGTITLERALTPDGTAWEAVAGPFRAAAVGSVIARPNDRFRANLRNYSQNVDYTFSDEDTILRQHRNLENEATITEKQSGIEVVGNITATGTVTGA